MTATPRRLSGKARSRLYALAGACFIVAGIMNIFAIKESREKWLMVTALMVTGLLYFLITYITARESKRPALHEANVPGNRDVNR